MAALFAALALIGAACGGDGDDTTSGTTLAEGESGPKTLTIGVDARSEEFATSWIHFFPDAVKAHPGDTIEFTSVFTGEPHTVAAGTLVDEAMEAFAKLPQDESAAPPPEVQAVLDKLPSFYNEEAQGPDDPLFHQAAAQPCYLGSEDPPTKEACPKEKQEAPEDFTGTERFQSSGFLPDGETVSFKLSEDIEPGDYTFMCLVHGPDMVETVTVVDKTEEAPGGTEVELEAEHQLEEFVGKVKAGAEEILKSTEANAKAGLFPEVEDLPSAGVNVFPEEIGGFVDEKVTWTIDGAHTIAFNAPEDARPWMHFDDKGELVANKKSFTPQNSPPIPDPPPAPEGAGGEGPPPQLAVDGGTWDGKGFRSSGFPFSDGQLVYSMAFSKAGTYKYLCLVHPDMEGTVNVIERLSAGG